MSDPLSPPPPALARVTRQAEQDQGARVVTPGESNALVPQPSTSEPSTGSAEAEPERYYRVVVDENGCQRCGHGTLWTVEDSAPEPTAVGQSWECREDAEDIADYMNGAREVALLEADTKLTVVEAQCAALQTRIRELEEADRLRRVRL